jgi:ribosomal protein S18 acetylase RimI-like enzyme
MIKVRQGYKFGEFDSLLAINNACYDGDECPTPSEFKQMLEISDVWVARHDLPEYPFTKNIPVGFQIVKEVGETIPYLWSLAVTPDWQNTGIGSRMLQFACMKYPKLELHCRADSPVQKLYFDHGFRVIDIARNYYKLGDKFVDGLKMRREV